MLLSRGRKREKESQFPSLFLTLLYAPLLIASIYRFTDAAMRAIV